MEQTNDIVKEKLPSKALSLLLKAKTVSEKAKSYSAGIKNQVFIDSIMPIQSEVRNIKEQLFDMENFTLDTNINSGIKQMTREDCTLQFKNIINLTYKLKLKELELKTKTEAFVDLFGSIPFSEE